MTTLLGDARIRVRADMTGFSQTVTREVETSSKEAKRHADNISKGLGSAAGAITGLAIIEGFKKVTDAARESQKVAAQTQAVLSSTGGAAHVSAAQVAELANSISMKTGIDDEAIQSGENLLLTFTGIRNEVGKGNDIFNQATMAVTDMSAALGQDMKSSAIQLGKALNDPIKGVSALQRVGVSFTEQQKEQIKTLVQSGHTLEAQKIILKEVNTEFGHSAEQMATPAEKLDVILGNLAEQAGTALLPALNNVANVMIDYVVPAASSVLGAFSDIPGPVLAGVAAFGGLVAAVKISKGAIGAVNEVLEAGKTIMGLFTVSTQAAAVAEGEEAAAADVAAASTSRFGAAAAAAGSTVGKLAGKAVLGGLVVGLAAASDKVTEWEANSEVATVKTDDLSKAIINITNRTGDQSAAIDLASNSMNIFGAKVGGGDEAMQSFADMAHGAFSNGIADVIGRAQSGSERMDRFKDVAGQLDSALADMVKKGHAADAIAFLKELKDRSGLSNDEWDRAMGLLPQYTQLMGGTGNATNDVAGQQANLAIQAKKVADAEQEQKDKTQALNASIKTINDSLQVSNNLYLTARRSEDAVYAATDALTASIKQNGLTLDVHTAKGRANRQALDGVAAAALGYLAAQDDNTKASPRFAQMLNDQRDKLAKAAEKFGLSKKAAYEYADQILKTPKQAITEVDLKNLQNVKNDLRKLQLQIQAMKGQNLEVVIDSHGTALLRDTTHAGKKDGGYISGPGGPRDDKAGLYPLSNGEYVVNAAATSRHRGLLESINKGMKDGGIVQNGPINITAKDHMPPSDWVAQLLQSQIDPMAILGAGGGGLGPTGAAGGAARWAGVILQALNMLGLSASWLPTVESRMNRESGGNPNAINLWDINAINGDPSKGLMQVIGATFAAFAGPLRGLGIWNPLANTYAGLNYAVHRYGSLAALNRPGGYANGTDSAAAGWHWTGENGPELVYFKGGETVKNHRDSTSALNPEIEVHVYIGDRELTEIIDVRVDNGNRRLAQAIGRGRR